MSESEVFYIAQPLKITQQQCLRCNSTWGVSWAI
ncbi:hypothetical protein [Nostoc sp. XA010]